MNDYKNNARPLGPAFTYPDPNDDDRLLMLLQMSLELEHCRRALEKAQRRVKENHERITAILKKYKEV